LVIPAFKALIFSIFNAHLSNIYCFFFRKCFSQILTPK
jgi:hypothetical protein